MHGANFYKTAQQPEGIIGQNDFVAPAGPQSGGFWYGL